MDSKTQDNTVSIDRGDRGKLYDTNGSEIKGGIEANLLTGRCIVWELRDGKKFVGSKKLIKNFPAPMIFVPI